MPTMFMNRIKTTGRYLTEFLYVAAFIPKPGKIMERQFGLPY
jgi:hypothetical protein